MPRNYKRKTETYSKENLENAIKEMNENGASLLEMSKKYSIPKSTLHDKISGKYKNPSVGRTTVLSHEEEKHIAAGLQYAAQYGWPCNRGDIRNMVQQYCVLTKKHEQWIENGPGIEFIRGFEKRWQHCITKRKPELVTSSRAKDLSEETIDQFFDMVKHVYEENNLFDKPNCIFNCDETGFNTDEKAKGCFFRRGVNFTPILNPSGGKAMYTVLFSGSAYGKIMPPFVVYKGKYLHNGWCTGGPTGTQYAVSPSGWMEDNVFENWLQDAFVPYKIKEVGDNQPVVLFMDGHASHLTYTTVNCAKSNNIILICLPPNSSHALQPLDVAYFSPLKKVWRNILRNFFRESRLQSIDKAVFPSLLKSLMEKSKAENIHSGFLGAGLFPLDQTKSKKKILPNEVDLMNEDEDANISKLHEAIIHTISPPLSKTTKDAIENKKKTRRRVQSKTGEILTSEMAMKRLLENSVEKSAKSKRNKKPRSDQCSTSLKVTILDDSDVAVVKQILPIKKDGNCIFSCIAQAIFGNLDDKTVKEVRHKVVDEVIRDWETFKDSIATCYKIHNAKEYAQYMKRNSTYGDDPELSALSKLFDVKIVIYQGPFSGSTQRTIINENCSRKIIRLHFHEVHYSIIIGKFTLIYIRHKFVLV